MNILFTKECDLVEKEDSAVIDLIVSILENERVINAVRNIGSGNAIISDSKPTLLPIFKKRDSEETETICRLEKENALLKTESKAYKKLKEDYASLEKNATNISKELNTLQMSYDTEKNKCEKLEASILKFSALSDALEVYENYCTLSESLRKDSLPYINDSTLITFIISGSSINTIMRFHEFIRERIQNNRISDIDILKNSFNTFFNIRTETYNDIFLYQPSIGEPFNSEKQIQLKGTNLGKISEVVFYGFTDKNGNIKAKPIVNSEG